MSRITVRTGIKGTTQPGEVTGESIGSNGHAMHVVSYGAGGSAGETDVYVWTGAAWAKLTQGQAAMASSLPVAIASDQTTIPVSGNAASAATDSGNPVKIGGLAKTALPTAVTDAQRVNGLFNKHGKQVAIHKLRENTVAQQTTITSSTGETTIVTADTTYKLDLYGLIVTNSSATGTKVTIKDATGGTTRIVLYVPALDTRGFMLPPDAGHPQSAINSNWTLACTTSVASIDVTALCVQEL